MEDLRLSVEEHPDEYDRKVILDGLVAFNIAELGDPGHLPLAVFVRDDDGAIRGGLVGWLRWGWLYVDKLWLPAELRGKGIGGRLLRQAEEFARARGATGTILDTFEFQALPFYLKQGYTHYATLDGYPAGRKQFFLQKWFDPAPSSGGA